MQVSRVERPLGSGTLSLETGKLAKQAHGAVVVRYGDTITLTAAVEGGMREGQDFFPLVVDYREKTYAAGKFPGGFIKREGRPTTKEILTSRLIDRPIRPLFPATYFNEVQVMASVLSADRENDPDVLSMIGGIAALHISRMPLSQPTGSVRVGRVGGELIVMPTQAQLEENDLDLIVSGTRKAVTMIEGFACGCRRPDGRGHPLRSAKHRDHRRYDRGIAQKAGKPKSEHKEPPVNPLVEIFRQKYYNGVPAIAN